MTKLLTVMHVNLAKGFRGGERQTELLIKALTKHQGVAQVVTCRADSPLRSHLEGLPNVTFLTANHQLDGHFCAPKVDIVHAHEAKAVHWAYIHKKLRQTPYILTRRVDTAIKEKWSNKQSYRNALTRVGISTLICNHVRDKQWGEVEQIPSTLAHLESDAQETQKFKAEFANKILVGHVGALVDRHKGQKVLIEAASLLEESRPDLHFVFFGDGADKEELKAYSKDNTNITWMGFKANIGDYLPALDIFAFPSRNEGLGSTLLDVMNAQVPIIASNVGGIPDIVIDQETGLLVPANDSLALKDAILKLEADKALQQALISGATERLAEYTPERMAERYLSIYSRTQSPR